MFKQTLYQTAKSSEGIWNVRQIPLCLKYFEYYNSLVFRIPLTVLNNLTPCPALHIFGDAMPKNIHKVKHSNKSARQMSVHTMYEVV